MSVRAISRVWERSRAKGSELLVLLAIADYADDSGRDAWPMMTTIAQKSRLSERGLREVMRRLVADAELAIEANVEGRTVNGGHRPRAFLHVLCCADAGGEAGGEDGRKRRRRRAEAPAKFAGGPADSAGVERPESPADISGGPAKIAGDRPANFAGGTGINTYVPPADGRTPLKEDPSGSVIEHTERARGDDPRRAHPLDEPPDATRRLEPWSLAAFDALYAIYPRQEARFRAHQAWHELNPSQELAAFIVAHVRTRVGLGWLKDTPRDKRPMLHTFLREGRFSERFAADHPVSAGPPDGTVVMRSCPGCGAAQEGKVEAGQKVFQPCAACGTRRGTA